MEYLGPTLRYGHFFMFLHFSVASLFIGLAIWAYSKHSLGQPITAYVIGMVLMVLFWIGFYIFGRIGKEKGKPQMKELYELVHSALEKEK
jgi:hypothetical protein